MKVKILLYGLLFYFSSIYSQIANIESNRIYNDTTKWTGFLNFNLNFIQDDIKIIQFGNQFHIQYKKDNTILLFINDISIIKTADKTSHSYNIQHLRYNYKLSEHITYESFLQTQYNKVLDINLRSDFGNGLRFRLKNSKLKIYYGFLIMYERYFYNTESCYKNGFLYDNYLSFIFHINDRLKILNTIYYQPYVNDLKNFKILDNFSISYNITKTINLEESLYYLYFKYHPSNIGNYISNEMFSLKYNF
jgi:hypothetical protein